MKSKMKKPGLILAIALLLAGVSVQAQKKQPIGRSTPPVAEYSTIVIQDDNGGGYLVFDPVSGAYKCNMCEYDYTFSGTGQVKVDGCNVYFSDIQKGYRLFLSANMCDHQAKMACEVFIWPGLRYDIEPILEYWNDSDMRNSVTACDVITDCQFTTMPSYQSFPAAGGIGSVSINAEDRCMWQAVSNVAWVTITSASVGVGKGFITYSVTLNNSGVARVGTMTVAGNTFTVKQKGT